MAETLTVRISGLRQGPVVRTWRLEAPSEALGEIPDGVRAVDVSVELRGEGRSGVRVRGKLSGDAHRSCRRCLAPVDVAFESDLDAWFRDPELVTPGEDGVWELEAAADEVDLSDAIREELWLALPDYVVCEEACEGLCPGCGVRLGEEECRCPPPAPDPRWDALEALRDDAQAEAGEPGPRDADPGEDA